ncbi:MAG: ABC transporter permease [Chlorobi bacterium]|nr:ABC transporter permease [Chlorobiota bacterium]
MNFPLFIARRYLIARKSHNVINLISIVSVVGVAVGTMALIVLLSVFNGFDSLVHSLFNTFDPDIKIITVQGKTFPGDDPKLKTVEQMPEIANFARVIEENALLRYGKKQYIATIKGVSDAFTKMSGIDTMMVEGDFLLWKKGKPMAVVGQGIAMNLSMGLNFLNPIVVYVPRRSKRVTLDPEKAFNRKIIFPSGFFAIQQDFDSRYVLVPIEFARNLLGYTNEISALELKLAPGVSTEQVKAKIKHLLGKDFAVKDRYEQQALLYRIMKTEKWAIFFILAFILIIASFNIIGSLTMLIIDKTDDIITFKSLGADGKVIRRIFLFEGWLISLSGALIGLVLGLLIAWSQMKFGIIKIPGSGSFVVDSYPVQIKITDVLIILVTVSGIGYLAAWYPVQFISRKLKLGLLTRFRF